MTTIVWLYSGAISGWWCYDKQSTMKLSKMYVNHCTKKAIDCSEFIIINTKSNEEMTNDFVDFKSDTDDSSDDEYYSNKNIIRTSHGDYELDFDKMIQFNVNDVGKKRSIKYMVIPKNIENNKKSLHKYLFDNGIKGISGVEFVM